MVRKSAFISSLLTVMLTSCSKPMARFLTESKDQSALQRSSLTINQKAETYLWDFGDGTTSQDISPTHKYITSGKYTVKLTAIKGKKQHTMEKNSF